MSEDKTCPACGVTFSSSGYHACRITGNMPLGDYANQRTDARIASLERELAEARAHLTAVLQMGQEAALKRENADLRAELAKYEEVAQTEDKTLNAWMKRCYDYESSPDAARAELAEARKALAQLREWKDAAAKVMSDYVRDATPIIAEVEAAARFCYIEGWNDVAHERGCDFNAAWSRYQQERTG